MSRWTDSLIAFGIGAALLAAMLVVGDLLYVGVWYYPVCWVALVGLVQLAKAPPLLTSGAASALVLSCLLYWAWQVSLPRPDGLLGLGHLFSLSGLGIAAVAAALIARRKQMGPWAAFLTGLLACCAGFASAQWLVCRTMQYCGVLSGPLG
ncbi:hypothetical protein ACFO3I_07890 [Rheinheimera marina]|uniref:DUF1097 domain-containing protein n=1 Tax=Rheinheimera marina TaxID=1774958 RepID=A0ABV9JL41_9GAMM